jgi:hypothetical protein
MRLFCAADGDRQRDGATVVPGRFVPTGRGRGKWRRFSRILRYSPAAGRRKLKGPGRRPFAALRAAAVISRFFPEAVMFSAKCTVTVPLAVAVAFLLTTGSAQAQYRGARQFRAWGWVPPGGWSYVGDGQLGGGEIVSAMAPAGAAGLGGGQPASAGPLLGANQQNPLYAALQQQRQNGTMSVFRQQQQPTNWQVLSQQRLYGLATAVQQQNALLGAALQQQQQNRPPQPPADDK